MKHGYVVDTTSAIAAPVRSSGNSAKKDGGESVRGLTMAVVSGAMGAGWPVLEEIAVEADDFSV